MGPDAHAGQQPRREGPGGRRPRRLRRPGRDSVVRPRGRRVPVRLAPGRRRPVGLGQRGGASGPRRGRPPHQLRPDPPGPAAPPTTLSRTPGEPSDPLVAAVRTTHDQDGVGNAPLLEVLVRAPGGQWSMAPVSTGARRPDDPSLLVDEATRTLRVFATLDGTVVTKTAPLDAISFAPGSGEPFVNGTGRTLSDPTVPKD